MSGLLRAVLVQFVKEQFVIIWQEVAKVLIKGSFHSSREHAVRSVLGGTLA
jgi:hypothetical protein